MQYHQEPWGTQLRKLATSIPSDARRVFSKSREVTSLLLSKRASSLRYGTKTRIRAA